MESSVEASSSHEEPAMLQVALEDEIEDAQLSLSIQIRVLRVLLMTGVMMVLLAGASYAMIDGFTISTIDATTLSDAEKSELLDKYNTYSGSIASIASMPFQQFVVTLLPVFFLCFTTKAIMSENKSFLAQWGPSIVAAAVCWVLNQGMNALNVQFDSPTVEYIISSSDLVATDAVAQFSILMTNITNTSHLAGVPSTDTLLRSAIHPLSSNSDTACVNDGNLVGNPQASVRFGFPINSWLENLLPESVASEASFSFQMGEDFSQQSLNTDVLPNNDVNHTAVLFSYAFWAVCQQFGCPVNDIVKLYKAVEATDTSDLLMNFQDVITDTTATAEEKSDLEWLTISIPEIVIEFATVDLSPQITFEAVTFDLPVKNDTMKNWTSSDTNESTWKSVLETSGFCNDLSCFMFTPLQKDLTQDQVRLLRLCMTEENGTDEDLTAMGYALYGGEYERTCRFVSNTSVLIYSFARDMSIDEININEELGYKSLELMNPRRTYRVTVGKLSWRTGDLAKVYGATCVSDTSCDGLYIPLSSVNQHVIVGESYIPTPHSIVYPTEYTVWQPLVLTEFAVVSTMEATVIYPPLYSLAEGSLPWTKLTGINCSYEGSDYINDIIQRHIYSKDPFQPAYTAGLFWLFQNAAVKDIQASSQSEIKLSFNGNREWISSRASIPRTSVFITIFGCTLVFMAGLAVVYFSLGSQRQSSLSRSLIPQNVASLRVDIRQFPPFLIHTNVQPHADDKVFGHSDIHSYQITELALQHRQYPDKNTLKVTRLTREYDEYDNLA